MKLKVLGSSSKGNCYLLIAESGQTLAVEAGVRFTEVQKATGFNVSDIVGCIVTHEHGDHAQYAFQFMLSAIDVYCSTGTADKLKRYVTHRLHRLASDKLVQIGEFKVYPFEVIHDAAEPFGYLIQHPESGNILFITDTFYSEFTFRNLHNIILEVNYDLDILESNIASGKLDPSIRARIITNHMSIQTAKELLAANDLSAVNNIVLIHLSDGNSNERDFQRQIELATSKTVTIADTGKEVLLNKTPF